MILTNTKTNNKLVVSIIVPTSGIAIQLNAGKVFVCSIQHQSIH